MSAHMIGRKVCFGVNTSERGGRRGQVRSRRTRWMCWMFAYRVTTRSTPQRVDSDLRTPSTQRDMTCASGRAPSTGRPIVTYLCTRQTPLIFLSFIAFVIVRSFSLYPPYFSPRPCAFLSYPYQLTSRLANKARRDNVALISSLRIASFYAKTA